MTKSSECGEKRVNLAPLIREELKTETEVGTMEEHCFWARSACFFIQPRAYLPRDGSTFSGRAPPPLFINQEKHSTDLCAYQFDGEQLVSS